ncbi:MAG: hypothetical protein HY665_05460 [Chloroflexi bacterium]|nr:hypothetical protein [Chloroflexota bacterium]
MSTRVRASHSDNISHKPVTARDRLKIVLLSLLAFCILAVSVTLFAMSIGTPFTGTVLSLDDNGWTVGSVDANSASMQAKIKPGDRPVEINGHPAEVFLEKYRRSGMVLGMLIREMTVVDGQGQLKSMSLNDVSTSWRSLVEQSLWFVVSLVFWLIGFYVLFKRPRKVAAWLIFAASLAFGLALSGNMAGQRGIPTAIVFEITAAVIGPWLLVHFFLVLPEERAWLRRSPLLYLVYLPPAITLVLFPLVGWSEGQPVQWFRTLRLFEYAVGFLAAAWVVVFNYFYAASVRTRQQAKIVLISCLAALVPFLLLNVLPEALWGRGQTIIPSGFGLVLIAFIPLGMGYAVVTQKLMDIDVVIRRGAVYGLIALVMAAVLSAAIFIVAAFRESLGTPQQIFLALALGGMATILFGPVKKGSELLVDKLFYKDRYDYRHTIQTLSTSLNSLKDSADISRTVVGTTIQTLNLAGGCLFVKAQSAPFEVSSAQGTLADAAKQKELFTLISQRNSLIEFPNQAGAVDAGVAFLIPLLAGEKEVGILCLSPKATRQDFSSSDMYLLQGVASVAATALRSAMLIKDVSMRDTFVSIASHELRTPLTSIVGYADLLLRRDPPEVTRKRWLKNILDNSQKITAMVDDLLNVTRIQSGKASLKLEPVQLSHVLVEQLSIIEQNSNKHEFLADLEPDLPDVLADHDKFGQVIGNLLNNAAKYSPNGGRITLAAHSDPARHRVVVSVADEGIGIGPEDRDSLFTTFHRIKRPETEGIGGSGLGLYIAKEWTEAMGGEIWLESELNRGSTFFVAIPMENSRGKD